MKFCCRWNKWRSDDCLEETCRSRFKEPYHFCTRCWGGASTVSKQVYCPNCVFIEMFCWTFIIYHKFFFWFAQTLVIFVPQIRFMVFLIEQDLFGTSYSHTAEIKEYVKTKFWCSFLERFLKLWSLMSCISAGFQLRLEIWLIHIIEMKAGE